MDIEVEQPLAHLISHMLSGVTASAVGEVLRSLLGARVLSEARIEGEQAPAQGPVQALIGDAERAAGERVRLTTVYCLGLCSAGPAARTGDRLHARLDASGLARVIENAR